MSGHGGHLGWRSVKPNIIFKGDHPRTISPKFGYNWLNGFREVDETVNPSRFFQYRTYPKVYQIFYKINTYSGKVILETIKIDKTGSI